MMERCMNLAVCDDDPIDLKYTVQTIESIARKEQLKVTISQYESCSSLLTDIKEGMQYHTLVLDVLMDGLNGMELAAVLRKAKNKVHIIFVSNNRDMALQGYEVSAVRYLMKPASEEKMREALCHCYRMSVESQEIVFPTARGVRSVPVQEIVYAETWGRGLRLHMIEEQEEEVNLKISDLESMLPANRFVLCHRAIIVNLEFVRYMRYCELELKTGAILPVSKYRQSDTREKLMRYLED